MISIKSVLTIFCLFSALGTFSQSQPEEYINPYVESTMQEDNLPGLVIAIVSKDSIVYSKGYGIRDINTSEPVDKYTLFQVASLTKPFTATLFGMLKDQGIVNLDDPIKKHIPEFELSDSCIADLITIKDLLSIRSGIDGSDNLIAKSREEFITLLRNMPVNSNFRNQQVSFNTHYTLAGAVIERIEKQSWEKVISDKLLSPLGMNNTYTDIHSAQQSEQNIASPHLFRNGQLESTEWTKVGIFSPAGGLVSNAVDLSKFIRLYLNEGSLESKVFIERESARQMFKPNMIVGDSFNNLFNPESDFMMFGYGWFLSEYKGRSVAEMEGSLPGTSSLIALLPEEDIGIIILTNKHFAFNSLVAIKFHVLDYFISE